MTATKKILIADDDESIRWVLRKAVEAAGFAADLAGDGTEALSLLSRNAYTAAFVDIRMPGLEGIEVLERVQARKSPTRFFIMTAVRRPEVAARAARAGAAEFITKPFDLAHVERLLSDLSRDAASRERPFRAGEPEEWQTGRVVGRSKAFLEVFQNIGKIADSDATVLILGERGVGKELIARCIHDLGNPGNPFVAVNTSALPRELQEAELFGYERGAFTGAEGPREGKIEAAMGGTLFLDEVGDTPLELQAKLLRVLQEKEFTRLGSNRVRKFSGRVIAATNRELRRLVLESKFREDLYDRLNVFPVRVPPLSERREDIPPLADFFLHKYCSLLSRPQRSFSKEALEELSAHGWKGNVRELENFVQRLAVLAAGKLIRKEEVARELAKAEGAIDPATAPLEQVIEERIRDFTRKLGRAIDSEKNLHELFLKQMERPLLKVVLDAAGGNQIRAAEILGINRNTLRKKLSAFGLLPRKNRRRPE